MKPGLNPNGKAMEFWSNIEKKLQKYIEVERHGKSQRKLNVIHSCLGMSSKMANSDSE